MSYKVRFHLAQGDHFMHWQIKNTETNEVTYADPKKKSIFMFDLKLRNQRGTAEKIHCGANKTVCAWVDVKDVLVVDAITSPPSCIDQEANYNPRVSPHWRGTDGRNIDNHEYKLAISIGSKVKVADF